MTHNIFQTISIRGEEGPIVDFTLTDKGAVAASNNKVLLNKDCTKEKGTQVTKTEEYMCPICKNCFSSLSIWKKHERIHKGEPPFACDFCEKKFKILSLLMKHRRSHNGEKAYTCDECKKGFSTKGSLRRHMNVHANEKPYTRADVSFSEDVRLCIHSKNHVCPFACDQCEEKFKTNKELELHIRTHLSNGNYVNEKRCDGTHTIEKKLKIQHDMGEHIQYEDHPTTKNSEFHSEQFIKHEIPETSTEQLILKNEDCSTITIENETIKAEMEDIIPSLSIVANAITNNRNSFESGVAAQQFLKDELTKANTDQLLIDNKVYTIPENLNIKTEQRSAVLDVIIDSQTTIEDNAVEEFIKDETSERTTQQLLIENEKFAMITLENETIKQETETIAKTRDDIFINDRNTFKPCSTVEEFIKDEETETSTDFKANNNIQTNDRPFACDFCEKKFPYLSTLNNHRRSHTGEKPFTCTECNQSFSVKESLNRHMRQHTGEKPFICTKCNQSFSLKSSLNRHMRGHTGEKPYICTECNQSFTAKQSLYHHMKRHTGEKPYTCTECNQSFARKQILNHHIRRHTGEKSHVCNECGLSFFEATRLRYHSKIHLRPFACDQCEEKFKSIKQLDQHIRIHSSSSTCENSVRKQKFKCKDCNGTYVTEEELDTHYVMGVHVDIEKRQINCEVCYKEFNSVKTLNCHMLEVHKEHSETFNNAKRQLRLEINNFNSSSKKIDEIVGPDESPTPENFAITNKNVLQEFIKEELLNTSTEELLLEHETIKKESINVILSNQKT